MKAKHTPGPWHLIEYRDAGGAITYSVVGADDDESGCAAWPGPTLAEVERKPDARLIAAAPDLLEACRHMTAIVGRLACIEDTINTEFLQYKAAFEAIANAEGSEEPTQ